MMATWMSYDDFTALIDCIFNISQLGCPIIYGISDNDGKWWDNSGTAYLGWQPKIMGGFSRNLWIKEWNALSPTRLTLSIRVVILQLIRYMLPKMTKHKGVTA